MKGIFAPVRGSFLLTLRHSAHSTRSLFLSQIHMPCTAGPYPWFTEVIVTSAWSCTRWCFHLFTCLFCERVLCSHFVLDVHRQLQRFVLTAPMEVCPGFCKSWAKRLSAQAGGLRPEVKDSCCFCVSSTPSPSLQAVDLFLVKNNPVCSEWDWLSNTWHMTQTNKCLPVNFITQPLAETHFVKVVNLKGCTLGVATGRLSSHLEKVRLWMQRTWKQLQRHCPNQSKVIEIWLQRFVWKSENTPLNCRRLISCYSDVTALNFWGICLRMKSKNRGKQTQQKERKTKPCNSIQASGSNHAWS